MAIIQNMRRHSAYIETFYIYLYRDISQVAQLNTAFKHNIAICHIPPYSLISPCKVFKFTVINSYSHIYPDFPQNVVIFSSIQLLLCKNLALTSKTSLNIEILVLTRFKHHFPPNSSIYELLNLTPRLLKRAQLRNITKLRKQESKQPQPLKLNQFFLN